MPDTSPSKVAIHLVKPVDPDALHGLVARLSKSTPEDSSTLH